MTIAMPRIVISKSAVRIEIRGRKLGMGSARVGNGFFVTAAQRVAQLSTAGRASSGTGIPRFLSFWVCLLGLVDTLLVRVLEKLAYV